MPVKMTSGREMEFGGSTGLEEVRKALEAFKGKYVDIVYHLLDGSTALYHGTLCIEPGTDVSVEECGIQRWVDSELSKMVMLDARGEEIPGCKIDYATVTLRRNPPYRAALF
jgi:hypothetical protein